MSREPHVSVDPESRLASIGRDAARLEVHEIAWRDKQKFLEEHGYMLRARFHPEWVPSWISNGQNPMLQEDFESLPVSILFFCLANEDSMCCIVSEQSN